MQNVLRRSVADRLSLLFGGLALAAIAIIALLGGAWLGVPTEDLPAPEPISGTRFPGFRQEEAERLALTMLAVSVAAVTFLAGLAALALERSVLAPSRARRGTAEAGGLARPLPLPPVPLPMESPWREAVRLAEPQAGRVEPDRVLEDLTA